MAKGQVWLVFGSCGDRDRVKRPIMGKIAAKLADQIVVTDEEPYTEDPTQIRREVLEGITNKSKSVEIADRREAMKYAFEHAHRYVLVLITGLGHEQYRIFKDYKQKWNDTQEAKKLLSK
jgi:UDP-N-acetylmuramoyl-L-alanyl-D-glutamate--2,6-diaminopimelate ligase